MLAVPETDAHKNLKTQALIWLSEEWGCDAVATEARLPLSSYRADVVGYRSRRAMDFVPGDTFAVECKQSRPDFLRDAGIEETVEKERDPLLKRVNQLRQALSRHLPDCRLHESLFSEYDTYDFSDWRHRGWFRLTKRLQALENRLATGTKFSRIARYCCASYCILAVEPGVIVDQSEIPLGWGCVVREGESLHVLKEAPRLHSRDEVRLKFLERIAISRNGSRLKRRRPQSNSRRSE